jgi:hypothetical protein
MDIRKLRGKGETRGLGVERKGPAINFVFVEDFFNIDHLMRDFDISEDEGFVIGDGQKFS